MRLQKLDWGGLNHNFQKTITIKKKQFFNKNINKIIYIVKNNNIYNQITIYYKENMPKVLDKCLRK